MRCRAAGRSRPSPSSSWWRPAKVAASPLLPSARYHPAPGELPAGALQLPWPAVQDPGGVPDAVVGRLARSLGAHTPGRLVASAKSWLVAQRRRPHRAHPALGRTRRGAEDLAAGGQRQLPRLSARRLGRAPPRPPVGAAGPGTHRSRLLRRRRARPHAGSRAPGRPGAAAAAGRAAGGAVRLAAPPSRSPHGRTGRHAPWCWWWTSAAAPPTSAWSRWHSTMARPHPIRP